MKRRASFKFPLHIEMLSSTVLSDIYIFHLSILPQEEAQLASNRLCDICRNQVLPSPVLCKKNFHTSFSRLSVFHSLRLKR
ncbi:hypothetical protein CEXT_437811 [Caerostris extrusa]|uniref:Uncharacterized protein n=1 Tax=Caerostris extrusa TaxID=172846 RepID=A0AAV4U1Q9_CAEEX|nr:hypothetical protein CEXT_437811 [Caerostris extrusa]